MHARELGSKRNLLVTRVTPFCETAAVLSLAVCWEIMKEKAREVAIAIQITTYVTYESDKNTIV